MNDQEKKEVTLNFCNQEIYCQIIGQGKELLIAFPGYGSTVDYYAPAQPLLAHKFTTWIIDLPLHGKTKWSKPMFTIADFTGIIQMILQRTGHLRFSLLGHSFGGRVVLSQIPLFGSQLNRVFLLAPDGIKNPGLMTVSWIPGWFRRMTSGWVEQSHRLLPFVEWLHRRKWIAPNVYSFAEYYLKTSIRRQQVKIYWISLADFQVDLPKLKQTIKSEKLRVSIFMGRRDKIIPSEVGKILKNEIETWVDLIETNTGHMMNGGAVLKLIDL